MVAEHQAIVDRLANIVGKQQAEELMEISEHIREVESRPQPPQTAMQRALELMETAEGRRKLATLTWDTV